MLKHIPLYKDYLNEKFGDNIKRKLKAKKAEAKFEISKASKIQDIKNEIRGVHKYALGISAHKKLFKLNKKLRQAKRAKYVPNKN